MPDPYISEVKYRGSADDDFIEVVVDEDMDVSGIQVVVYHPSGDVRSTNSLGSQDGEQFDHDIYVVNTGVHMNGAVALVQDGVVISFISFDAEVTANGGPADGMTSDQVGSTGNDSTQSVSSTDGTTYTAGDITENTIPCFLQGTMICTRYGEVTVEDLIPGDQVVVRDGAYATLRWVGWTQVDATGPEGGKNAPIRIPRNAFGKGAPTRDLYVSPNHRIWMNNPSFEYYFAEREVLVPAKHLIGWKGISKVSYVPQPRYFHLLFDCHEIVLSDGLPTESLHPSVATMDQFEHEARDELLRLFPELAEVPGNGKTARHCLKSYEVPLAQQAMDAA